LYYNPNIYPESEFIKRAAEQRDFLNAVKTKHPVSIIVEEHRPSNFMTLSRDLRICRRAASGA
jgi:predicted adenine nucleotide alpha hydrolase (AANH) superfamily ATPase